jgi:CHAD domain-containing protein
MVRSDLEEHVTPDTPTRDAARAIIDAKVRPLFDLEADASSGTDADAVHDMRVASRRVREALRVFSPVYRRKAVETMDDVARAVTRALGTVRDADVLIAALEQFYAKASDDQERSVLTYLIGYRQGVREGELMQMRRRLNKLDLRRERKRFERALRNTRSTSEAKAPLARTARAVMSARMDDFFEHLPDALVPERIEAQHAMRIAGKHLRYAIETLGPCIDADAYPEVHEALVRYQDVLGEMHDCDVWTAFVLEVGPTDGAGRTGQTGEGARELLDHIARRRRRYFGEFRRHLELYGEQRLRSLIDGALLAETPEPVLVTALANPVAAGPLVATGLTPSDNAGDFSSGDARASSSPDSSA